MSVKISYAKNIYNNTTDASIIYNSISKLNTKDLRNLAFSSLNSIEKKQVWDYKFSILIKQYSIEKNKLNYILRVYNLFKKYNYTNFESENKTFIYSLKSAQLFEEGKKYIENDLDRINIFFELVPLKKEELNVVKNSNIKKLNTCECVAGKQGGCFGTLPNGDVVIGTCYDKNCEKQPGSGGCSWFGSEPCDAYKCGFFN